MAIIDTKLLTPVFFRDLSEECQEDYLNSKHGDFIQKAQALDKEIIVGYYLKNPETDQE